MRDADRHPSGEAVGLVPRKMEQDQTSGPEDIRTLKQEKGIWERLLNHGKIRAFLGILKNPAAGDFLPDGQDIILLTGFRSI